MMGHQLAIVGRRRRCASCQRESWPCKASLTAAVEAQAGTLHEMTVALHHAYRLTADEWERRFGSLRPVSAYGAGEWDAPAKDGAS